MSYEKQDFYYLRLSKEDGDIEAMISRELLKNPKLHHIPIVKFTKTRNDLYTNHTKKCAVYSRFLLIIFHLML